ncbi:MAG: N-acetylmuramoyl-L-alanine amidase [Acidimicrobiia bacterium]|nr:N-acetylmuramoyl-L-alanine amidase [Acidimicrobiia bacterium]
MDRPRNLMPGRSDRRAARKYRRVATAIVLGAVIALGALGVALAARPDSGRGDSAQADTSSTRPPTTTAKATTTTKADTSTTRAPTTTVPVGALSAVSGHTIVVDAGHNGGNNQHGGDIARMIFIGTQDRACDTTGASTNDGYAEYDFNLDVALRLRTVLSAAGANVTMIRTTNDGWGPCIDERAYIGNRAGAEAGISIHADGGPGSGRGFHVNVPANIPGYTNDIYAASRELGTDLRDAYLATGMPTATYLGAGGMLERRDFGGLNLSDVPKVLFEAGNMRNATDAALLKDPTFRQRIADTLAAGFATYFAGR